jgi:copper oxidase (laccase) domain-containing protein
MIELFRSEMLERYGFGIHGFTKRKGGESTGGFSSLNLAFNVGDNRENVIENLKRLKSKLNVDAPLVRVNQTHSKKVVGASECLNGDSDSWTRAPTVEADGIIAGGNEGVLARSCCSPTLRPALWPRFMLDGEGPLEA